MDPPLSCRPVTASLGGGTLKGAGRDMAHEGAWPPDLRDLVGARP